jgi:hypothetical protein
MSKKSDLLSEFELYRGNGGGIESWFGDAIDDAVVDALSNCERQPISFEILNQLLILSHEGGITYGFFQFYFLSDPHKDGLYPYDPKKLPEFDEAFLHAKTIINLRHLKWGLKRLYIDALLFFGNIRQCFRTLRSLSAEELNLFFRDKIFNSKDLMSRGDYMPLEDIAKDDRYLIAEVACKTYDPTDKSAPSLLEYIKSRYKEEVDAGRQRIKIKDLIAPRDGEKSRYDEYQLSFSLDEAVDRDITKADDLEGAINPLIAKFTNARTRALKNTKQYLSMVSDLDVYVATSMRSRDDFRLMADFCEEVFRDDRIRDLNLREVPEMIRRIFKNDMEFELSKKSDNYFLLREMMTGSTVRVQSSDLLLRETFWNYYHWQPPYRRG